MNTFSERLKAAMTATGTKSGELADVLGVSNTAISLLRSGESKSMKPENLLPAAKYMGVSINWLVTGKGEMIETDSIRDQVLAQFVTPVTTEQLGEDDKKIWVDLVDIGFSCGNGENIEFHFSPIAIKSLSFDPSFFTKRKRKPENCRFAYVKGDSMEMFLYDGDIFGMDITDTTIVDGDIYAVYFAGEAMLKQIFIDGGGKLTLHSLNPKWRDKVVDESNGTDFRVIGKQFYRSG